MPPAVAKGPQAFGLEESRESLIPWSVPQTYGLAAVGGGAQSTPDPPPPVTCCPGCGHSADSVLCCTFAKRARKECAKEQPRLRLSMKSKGCDKCKGPCAPPQETTQQEMELQEEVDVLNAPGNWRHRKARNIAIQEAAPRHRDIPTLAEAQTDAQRRMATLAAKFRKP